jgi:hypothetical protein
VPAAHPETRQAERVLLDRAAGALPECEGSAVKSCVGRYARPALTPAEVRRFLSEGVPACFAVGDPAELARQGACLPLELGRDPRNTRVVEVVYHCSDVCPANGRIVLRYAGADERECCAIGGHPRRDPAWGGFVGCEPPEVPLPTFRMRAPDGTTKLAVRSPCEPQKVTVVGEEPTPRAR